MSCKVKCWKIGVLVVVGVAAPGGDGAVELAAAEFVCLRQRN